MAKEQKGVNLYLMSIVAIVAIVGIVILVLNIGGSGMMWGSSGVAGQAYATETTSVGTGTSLAASRCHPCPSNPGEIVCGSAHCSVRL